MNPQNAENQHEEIESQRAQEMADACHPDKENPDHVKGFLRYATPREIQAFAHALHKHVFNTNAAISPHYFELGRLALDVRLSEDQANAAEKMEKQTNRLIILTYWLVFLTIALLVVTVAPFFSK